MKLEKNIKKIINIMDANGYRTDEQIIEDIIKNIKLTENDLDLLISSKKLSQKCLKNLLKYKDLREIYKD